MKKIEARNIYKRFQNLEVLKGIDLEVSEGEVVAVIGPSGGGKSTLLRCLNKLETIEKALCRHCGSFPRSEAPTQDCRACRQGASTAHRRQISTFCRNHPSPYRTHLCAS